MSGRLEVADIQGDILRSYGLDYRFTRYVFVRVDDPSRGRPWLSGLLSRITTAEPWPGEKPETTLNIALTCGGLTALGVPRAMIDTFSEEFRQGMAARAHILGDTGAGDPAGWDGELGTGSAHVMATVNARSAEHLVEAVADLRRGIEKIGGLTIVYEQTTERLEDAREHFGFADGFAQPAVEGSSEERTRGGGVPDRDGRWRPLAPGEFVLGYEDEDSRTDPQRRLPSAPADPLGRNGTYVVWRKLHQDVALFRRILRDAARLYENGDEEKLAAKVVGRWRDATPLVHSPVTPSATGYATRTDLNDFRYADVDSDGRRCPLGAHIRRANPRDALDPDARLSFRHRMIRRGMPYGPPLPAEAPEDDGQDRGLVFACFVASISRQFESVQTQWLNTGNSFHLGSDKDFLLGDQAGTGKMTVQGDPPFFLAPQSPFVTMRGGEYLFMPGIRALKAIAEGTLAGPDEFAAELAGLPVVEGVDHRMVEIDGPWGRVRMHVAEAGRGDPVLLLHGWPEHWYSWRDVVPHLADAYRLVIPDHRGFGWSQAPGRGYHPEVFAADALALLDALGLERVAVIGHDWGGFAGLLLALRHPERIARLVVCNAPQPWARLSWPLVASARRAWYVPVLAAPLLGPRLVSEERFLARLLALGERDVPSREDVRAYAQRLRDPARADASSKLYRSYIALAVNAVLRRHYDRLRLSVPTRVLFGREDAYIPLEYLRGVEAHGDDIQVELVPDCGHWTPEERPQLVAERARAHFAPPW